MSGPARRDWRLDPRLQQDCHELGRLACASVLLMDNADYPWFILVPFTDRVELHELDADLREALWQAVIDLSRFVSRCFATDKINVAAIGNVVRQLHVHVVGRREDDPCWPGVVWGTRAGPAYTPQAVAAIRRQLQAAPELEHELEITKT